MVSHGQSGSSRDRWGFLCAATLGRAAVGFQFQALPALAPALGLSLGLGLSEIGVLTGLYMLPGVAVALLGGVLLQRFTVRAVLIGALTAMIAAGVVSFAASGFYGQAAARLVGGFGGVLLIVATLKGMYDWFTVQEMSLANGVSGAAHSFGMGCALLIFSAMGADAIWRLGLLATGAVAALALLAVLLLTPRAAGGDAPAGMAATLKLPRHELAKVLAAACVIALYTGNFHAFLSFFPSYLFASGWSPGETASLMGLLGWGPIIMATIGGLIAARTRHVTALIAICIVAWGGGIIGLSLIGVTPWLIALILVFGPLILGPVLSLGAQTVAPERRGIGSGIFMAGFFLGNAALPAASAWVGESAPQIAGSAEKTALMFCGVAFLGALVPLGVLERLKARQLQSL